MTTTSNNIRLPKNAEVVIIGGGIIGCCTAYYLAKAGVDVVLCEKAEIAAEQSSRNWGFIRKQGRHPDELPMMIRSLQLWQEIVDQLQQDIGFRIGGTLYLSDTERRYQTNQSWLKIAEQHGVDSRFISVKELEKLIPSLQGQTRGALYTPSDAQAEPLLASRAIAKLAEQAGAKLFTHCAVRGLTLQAGKISEAVTEHGTIKSSTVVCCGGAWSSYFCRHLDIVVPQLKVVSSVMATEPTQPLFEQSLWSTGLGMRRRADNGYNIACGGTSTLELSPDFFRFVGKFLPAYKDSKELVKLSVGKRFFQELNWPQKWDLDKPAVFEKERVLDPKPCENLLAQAYKNLQKGFPTLTNIKIVKRWAGMIDVTPDELPIISHIPQVPGLILSTGYSGHGFGIAPGAGETTAKLVLGENISDAFHITRLLKQTPDGNIG